MPFAVAVMIQNQHTTTDHITLEIIATSVDSQNPIHTAEMSSSVHNSNTSVDKITDNPIMRGSLTGLEVQPTVLSESNFPIAFAQTPTKIILI